MKSAGLADPAGFGDARGLLPAADLRGAGDERGELDPVGVAAERLSQSHRMLEDVMEASALRPRAVPQEFGLLGHGHRELIARGSFLFCRRQSARGAHCIRRL